MTKPYVAEMVRAGGKILANTKIKMLRHLGDRWILQGRYTDSSSSYQIKITAKTVFIAAGAVHTSALLRRSGITRNIGNALQMHPTVKVVAQFSEPVSSAQLDVAVHQVKEFAP
ncbi:GMC family oxidoreductase N-terminal domain-containing protein, partial [Hydrocoleum sp. CS-953]|uniref:GMC family oxidoreductase N-terminal domain-containing protein n=1 Tax=Hydrocoleum sp. CS-953 TaxID=1671698 RepID=UPI001AF027C6